ncbi:unnamed protein product, partial [Rotaria sp. Silwood1]
MQQTFYLLQNSPFYVVMKIRFQALLALM